MSNNTNFIDYISQLTQIYGWNSLEIISPECVAVRFADDIYDKFEDSSVYITLNSDTMIKFISDFIAVPDDDIVKNVFMEIILSRNAKLDFIHWATLEGENGKSWIVNKSMNIADLTPETFKNSVIEIFSERLNFLASL